MTESNAFHRLVRRVPARIAGVGVLTLALTAGFAGGRATLTASGEPAKTAQAAVQSSARAAVPATPQSTSAPVASYSNIVERVAPAVVTVRVEKRAEAQQTNNVPDE